MLVEGATHEGAGAPLEEGGMRVPQKSGTGGLGVREGALVLGVVSLRRGL